MMTKLAERSKCVSRRTEFLFIPIVNGGDGCGGGGGGDHDDDDDDDADGGGDG